MTYKFDRNLFLENGPTLLAERDRKLRAASEIYRLLGVTSATSAREPDVAFKAAA